MATVNLGRIKPQWQGTYASETSYVVDDMVLYNNSAYICTAASQGNAPTNTSYWDLMTQGFSGDAADLSTGTIPDARFPSTLPALDGSALTNLPGGGKLLQVTANNGTSYSQFSSPSNNTWGSTVVAAAITPQSSTSRIFVSVTFGLQTTNSSTDFGVSARMARTINGGTTYPTNLNWHNGTNCHSIIYEAGTSGEDNTHRAVTLTGYDSTHGTTSYTEYALQTACYDVNSYGVGGPYGHRWSITLMEIEV